MRGKAVLAPGVALKLVVNCTFCRWNGFSVGAAQLLQSMQLCVIISKSAPRVVSISLSGGCHCLQRCNYELHARHPKFQATLLFAASRMNMPATPFCKGIFPRCSHGSPSPIPWKYSKNCKTTSVIRQSLACKTCEVKPSETNPCLDLILPFSAANLNFQESL